VAWPLHGVTKRGGDLTAEYIIDYCSDHKARYGIDHVDILLWIALELYPESQDKAMEEVRKGFDALKRDGFCDHLGFSCHHSPEMAAHAINSFGDFSVMMVPYGPLNPAAGKELLPLARSKGIGTVTMKPFCGGSGFFNKAWSGEAGADLLKWKESGHPYQAAIRWVLANESIDCTAPGLHSVQEIDEIVSGSKEPLSGEDGAILDSYRAAARAIGAAGTWDG
jgi:aryl-alcohol dehydrogenase-like predicted oxidoreductase